MRKYAAVKPALWGAAAGAVAISVIGFSSFGWVLGSTAERQAQVRADDAVVAVLAPICVEKFQRDTDATAKLVEFKKIASWDRRAFIEKGGWAVMPGSDRSSSAVVSACAERLGAPL
jgi:hypothetical protein